MIKSSKKDWKRYVRI